MNEAVAAVKRIYADARVVRGEFSGGNDSGGYDNWSYTTTESPIEDAAWEPIPDNLLAVTRAKNHQWENVNAHGLVEVRLIELLEQEYGDAHNYGSFAGEFEVNGYVEIDVKTGKVIGVHGQKTITTWHEF